MIEKECSSLKPKLQSTGSVLASCNANDNVSIL